MRRLCCFCERWETGGIESFLCSVLSRLTPGEFEIDIVAACVKPSVFTERLEKYGIRFIQLSGHPRKQLANNRLFRELVRERRYDVVYLNLFQGLSLWYGKIAQTEGVPVRIVHCHSNTLRRSPTRLLKLAVHHSACALLGACATQRWACSGESGEFMFGKKQNFRVIPNGIDTERFRRNNEIRRQVRAELGVSDCFVVGNVGRLCVQKNQDFLLDVFAEVLKRRPDSRLLLVGEGEGNTQTELEEKAKRLNIDRCVNFYGVTDRVEHLMWAMDVFAFPSVFEGLGIVAVEAQAAGLPVVASDCVPEEAVVTDLIWRYPLGDPSAWAEILLAAAAPDGEDWCKQVRAAGFDIEDVVKEIEGRLQGTCR